MQRWLPWALALAHSIWLLTMLALEPVQTYPGPQREGEFSVSSWHMSTSIMVAGRDFHHHSGALVLFMIDFPALAVLVALTWPFGDHMSPVAASYVLAVGWLILGSAWWFLIGKLLSRRTWRRIDAI